MKYESTNLENLENYTKEKLTVDVVYANIFALFLFIPIIASFGIPYYLIWQEKFSIDSLKSFLDNLSFLGFGFGTLSFFISLAAGIILHELIHGISWAFFTEKGFKSIKFGIMWTMLTPYCHCKEPLKIKHYIFGAVMPGILLGIVPAIIAILIGSPPLLVFSIIFTGAAGGDFIMVYRLRNESMNSLVQDHPSEIGCYIYRKSN